MVGIELGITVVVGDEDGTADSVTLGSEEVLGAALASKEACSDGLEVVVGIELGIIVVVGDDDGAPDEETLGPEEVLGARLASNDGTEDKVKDTVGL